MYMQQGLKSMQQLRIGVLMGGKSLEKEVSFNSGRTVCDHLDTTRYIAVPLFQSDAHIYLLPWHFLHRGKTTDFEHRLANEAQKISWDDLHEHIDFMYIAQHGRYAEDGCLQGFLEILKIPYIGSNILASALRADKHMHKILLHNAGIEVPEYIVVEPNAIDNFEKHKDHIFTQLKAIPDKQYIVKPYNEGSSLGISVADYSTLEDALKKACYIEPHKKKRVLIEEKITGMEFTCIVLTDHNTGDFFALPPTESISDAEVGFFDYEQKYMPGRGIKRTPAHCSPEITKRIQQTCIKVMNILDFATMGRIDGFVTENGKIIIIDPNTLSGMAPSSYIFNQAAEIHMSPSQLINFLIEGETKRYKIDSNSQNRDTMDQPLMHSQKKRVAVLLGGASNEKETSLDSGRNVFYKLSPQKYEASAIFVSDTLELYKLTQSQLVRNSTKEIVALLQDSQKIKWSDLPDITDFVFNALHGGEGENGSVQGTLEMIGLPYNGSSVLASALCINKYKTNEFLAMNGFDVPKHAYITKNEWKKSFDLSHVTIPSELKPQYGETKLAIDNIAQLSYPLIIKPHDDGCSVMVQKAENDDELIVAIEKVFQEKDAVLIEEYITGMELTVGVIGNVTARALPPSQAISAHGILSIEEKFLPGAGENQTPAPLSQEALRLVQNTVEKAYTAIGCKGYARIDCFYQTANISPTGIDRVIILEINTLPGLTPATCLFHQAAEIGLKPMEFIDTIINLGFEEHTLQNNTQHDIKSSEITT